MMVAGALPLQAQYTASASVLQLSLTMSYLEVQEALAPGGSLEGYRYLTESEAWNVFRFEYGYRMGGYEAANFEPAFQLLQEVGVYSSFSQPWYRSHAFAYLADGSSFIFSIFWDPHRISDRPYEYWGDIRYESYTRWQDIGDRPVSGHLLVSDDYVVPVPEPARIGVMLVPVGLILILWRRRAFLKLRQQGGGQKRSGWS